MPLYYMVMYSIQVRFNMNGRRSKDMIIEEIIKSKEEIIKSKEQLIKKQQGMIQEVKQRIKDKDKPKSLITVI